MLRLNGGNTVTLGRTEVQNPELRFPSGFTTFSESSLGTCPESHFERQESGFRDREIDQYQAAFSPSTRGTYEPSTIPNLPLINCLKFWYSLPSMQILTRLLKMYHILRQIKNELYTFFTCGYRAYLKDKKENLMGVCQVFSFAYDYFPR